MRVAQLAAPQRLVLVAPGITRLEHADFEAARAAEPACPWLVVQGDADDVVPPQAVLAWAAGRRPLPGIARPDGALLRGAGHFFHGRINELREAVLAFMPKGRRPAKSKGPGGALHPPGLQASRPARGPSRWLRS